MANTCVFCNTSSNLNTEMTIKLEDGSKITVHICDEHAEDATIKTAREAYSGRQQQIDAVLAQAKELGLELKLSEGGIATLEPEVKETKEETKEEVKEAKIKKGPKISPDMEGDDVISTSKIDSASGMVSVGGNAGGHAVESLPSHDMNSLSDQLPTGATEGKAKMTMAEGRGGQPIAIPQKRVDGTGTTRINIVNTGGDRALQERFKNMASDDTGSFKDGYQGMSECPICRGDCVVMNKNEETTCPKCQGSGFISR